MIIRQIRDADIEETSKVITLCLNKINRNYYTDEIIDAIIEKNSPEHILEDMKTQLIVVADLYGDIIGTARIQFKKEKNYFGSVFVHPDYIKQGIGKIMLSNLEEMLQNQGTEKVTIHVSINAVEFYEKQGYTRLDLISDKLFGKSYRMVKNLK